MAFTWPNDPPTAEDRLRWAAYVRVCEQCGVEFLTHRTTSPGRFCSRECRYESMRRLITLPCDQCGTPITGKPSRFGRYLGRSFCTKLCQGEWRRRNPTAVRFSKVISERLRDLYGRVCVICGEARVVEYAHKIPARDGGTIHPANIYPLCPTHHTIVDNCPDKLTAEERANLRTVAERDLEAAS